MTKQIRQTEGEGTSPSEERTKAQRNELLVALKEIKAFIEATYDDQGVLNSGPIYVAASKAIAKAQRSERSALLSALPTTRTPTSINMNATKLKPLTGRDYNAAIVKESLETALPPTSLEDCHEVIRRLFRQHCDLERAADKAARKLMESDPETAYRVLLHALSR